MACESGMCFPDYKSSYLAPSDCKSDGTGWLQIRWNVSDGTRSDGTCAERVRWNGNRTNGRNEDGAEEDGGANCGERGHAVRSASAYSAASTRVLPAKYCPVLRGTGFPTWDSVCFPCLLFLAVSAFVSVRSGGVRFGVRFGGFVIRRV